MAAGGAAALLRAVGQQGEDRGGATIAFVAGELEQGERFLAGRRLLEVEGRADGGGSELAYLVARKDLAGAFASGVRPREHEVEKQIGTMVAHLGGHHLE